MLPGESRWRDWRAGRPGSALIPAARHYGGMHIVDVDARLVGSIPLPEVSGLAIGLDRDAQVTVAAIGDKAASIVWATVEGGIEELAWQTLDLREAEGTRIPRTDPQLEAIAVDGALGILLVQESPCRAEYIDARQRRVLAHITLDIPDEDGSEALRRSWRDPGGSHAEGVVLLKDGHLLIVKEKDPAALLEFGPAGDPPRGFGGDRWLDAGQPWWPAPGSPSPSAQERAQEVDLVLLAAWAPTAEMVALCPDLSDAAVGPAGNLILLSDKGCAIAVVPASSPAPSAFDGSFEATTVWRMSGIPDKPEGIAVLPNLDVLVACDRRKPKKNLFVIPRTEWDRR